MTGFYNREWMGLLRGTSLMFKYNLLIFVFKAFNTSNCPADLAILAVNVCRKVREPKTTHAVLHFLLRALRKSNKLM
jgi:hypothetical protein